MGSGPFALCRSYAQSASDRAAILDRQKWWNDDEYRRNEIQPEDDLTLPQCESAVDPGDPIIETGLVSDLGCYAKRGELFLTTRITRTDADRIREEMRSRALGR